MLLLSGASGPVLDAVERALTDRGHPHRRVEKIDFDEVFTARAEQILLVEPDDAAIDAAIGAASAPRVSLVAIVTARAADDAGLLRIRRSGAPYVVILCPRDGGPPDTVARCVCEALADPEAVGRTITPAMPEPPPAAVTAPRQPRTWRERLGAWFRKEKGSWETSA